MIPYILLLTASLIGGLVLKKWPAKHVYWGYLLVMGCACWLLSALRYLTGFDYRFYESVFQTIRNTPFPAFLGYEGMEPGFLLLNKLVAWCGGDYRVFLVLFHLLLTAMVFWWIGKYSKSPWLSVFLYITLQFFAMSMNLLRQSMAASIFLLAYPFLTKRKLIPYCAVILVAACFHRSVLIMLPLYFLLHFPITKLHYGIALITVTATYFFMDPLLQWVFTLFPKYQHYLDSKYWQGNSFIYVLLPLCCFLFRFPVFRKEYRERIPSPILTNALFYSLLIQLFITRHFLLERFSIYIALFALLALPEAALTPYSKVPSKVRITLLLLGGFAYFLFAAVQGFHDVYPYVGFWQQAL